MAIICQTHSSDFHGERENEKKQKRGQARLPNASKRYKNIIVKIHSRKLKAVQSFSQKKLPETTSGSFALLCFSKKFRFFRV